jgi:DNA polymerase-3 subunit delta'
MAIVDDADRLSIAAQNALLKTLEEPPGQALIVLLTAAPGRAAADGPLALPTRCSAGR